MKIYTIRLAHCYGGHHCRIAAMKLCAMAKITERLSAMRRADVIDHDIGGKHIPA
jgi:hypothetical protein